MYKKLLKRVSLFQCRKDFKNIEQILRPERFLEEMGEIIFQTER